MQIGDLIDLEDPIIVALVIGISTVTLITIIWLILRSRMTGARNKAASAWREVDTHLRRRSELIPQLVELAKDTPEYAQNSITINAGLRVVDYGAGLPTFGRETDEKLKLRTAKQLVDIIKSYPELTAKTAYSEIVKAVALIEPRIATSSRFYGTAVERYNKMVLAFPTSFLASMASMEVAPAVAVGELIIKEETIDDAPVTPMA